MRRLLVRTGLAALGLLGALLLAELAVRLLGLGPDFQVLHRELFQLTGDSDLGYELRPLAPDGDTRINAAGFRGREYALEKPDDVVRIVAVGDSVTFGQPRRASESWPAALELHLNSRGDGRSYEILNLGVTGYNVLQVAARLRALGLAYDPDLVLYGYVLNDPQELSIELEALRDLRSSAESRFRAELASGVRRVLAHSRLYQMLRSRLRPAVPGRVEFRHRLDPAYEAFRGGDRRGAYFRALHEDPAGRERLRTGLERLSSTVEKAGVPLVMVLFPLLLDPRAGPYPLDDVHALVAEEARANGCDVIDLRETFAHCERCAVDFLHPNGKGSRAAAEGLAAGLERLGLLSPDGQQSR